MQGLIDPILIGAAMGSISLVYATVGQAGGTAFLAVMAITAFAPAEMRPTSLFLNIVAASYSTWRLHRSEVIDWTILKPIALASIPGAFVGGLIILDAQLYKMITGAALFLAAMLMITRRRYDGRRSATAPFIPILLAGAGVGLVAGLTGVGGGVFLAPVLIFAGWVSPRSAAAISAPFILANSVVGLAGVSIAGQQVAADAWIYAIAALGGTVIGTAIHLRWMSQAAVRYILAAILLFAAYRLLSPTLATLGDQRLHPDDAGNLDGFRYSHGKFESARAIPLRVLTEATPGVREVVDRLT